MRLRIFVSAILMIVIPVLLMGETVYLTDGSTLKGKLRKFENDTLHFETDFGAMVKIDKTKIVRIDFAVGAGAPVAPAVDVGFDEAVPGSLQVVFDKVKFTTRINVERGRNREAVERENSIEQRLLVGDKQVHSHVDSVTDKVIRNGPDTTLRNEFEAQDFKVVLEPNMYHLTLMFGNTFVDEYANQLEAEPLERELRIDNVTIEPGKTTRIRVGVKRKRFGVKKTELYVVK